MSGQPDEDELQLRDRLRDLGVSYAPAPAGAALREPGEGHLEQAAPAAEEASVPAPRRTAPRLPDWWAPERPDVTAEDKPAEPAPAPSDEDAEDQEEPALPQTPATPSSSPDRADFQTRMREWLESKREPARPGDTGPDDDHAPDDDEDTGEDDGDTAGDGPEPGGPVRKMATGLKRRARRPGRRPRFAAAGVPHTMKPERRSLVEIIRSTPDQVWWMAYNGSALAAGFWLGWPQWVKDGTAFLAAEHPTLTDTYSLTCYALAAGVLVLDYRARGWLFPVSWLARIPTASLVVGVPLYGVDTPISQLY
ncbi:hypothetical protein [Streptomyces sp. CCM_MD2014]|uniref:hypothetical protein n=1 Tax=Streptomyces sp. CCM_MD2014 TaxID=1561022 RepID=UPI00052AA0C8|nr:hypothetical protein [Streptomyces sp. CCM_MD2014]AIV35577.1 hypothetical protein NI25_20460 [Streptomyces sp. CCM_MD2014]